MHCWMVVHTHFSFIDYPFTLLGCIRWEAAPKLGLALTRASGNQSAATVSPLRFALPPVAPVCLVDLVKGRCSTIAGTNTFR